MNATENPCLNKFHFHLESIETSLKKGNAIEARDEQQTKQYN